MKTKPFVVLMALMFLAGAMSAEEPDLERRLKLAEELVRSQETEGRLLDPSFRNAWVEALRKETIQDLEARLGSGNLAIAPMALGAFRADQIYTTFQQPCRILDTRIAPNYTALVPGNVTNFVVVGPFDFERQGGTGGGCGVPYGASAAMINFVAVAPSGAGHIKGAAYPNNMPFSSILNYQSFTPALNLANGLLFPLCERSAPGCFYDISVQANGAGTHLVADVLGYTKPFPKAKAHPTVRETFWDVWTRITPTCVNYFPANVTVTAPFGVPGKVWAHAMVEMRIYPGAASTTIGSVYEVYMSQAADFCSGAPTATMGSFDSKTVRRRGVSGIWAHKYVLLDTVIAIDGGATMTITLNGRAYHEQAGDEGHVMKARVVAQFIPD
jgi:hypothetical protein